MNYLFEIIVFVAFFILVIHAFVRRYQRRVDGSNDRTKAARYDVGEHLGSVEGSFRGEKCSTESGGRPVIDMFGLFRRLNTDRWHLAALIIAALISVPVLVVFSSVFLPNG